MRIKLTYKILCDTLGNVFIILVHQDFSHHCLKQRHINFCEFVRGISPLCLCNLI